MTANEKIIYKRLRRQVQQRYAVVQRKVKPVSYFNNKLEEMQTFLHSLEGDYSNNRFMKLTFIKKV